jgi:hypothetical protein
MPSWGLGTRCERWPRRSPAGPGHPGPSRGGGQGGAVAFLGPRPASTGEAAVRPRADRVAPAPPTLSRDRFYIGRLVPGRAIADVTWHGARLDSRRGPMGRLSSWPPPWPDRARTNRISTSCSPCRTTRSTPRCPPYRDGGGTSLSTPASPRRGRLHPAPLPPRGPLRSRRAQRRGPRGPARMSVIAGQGPSPCSLPKRERDRRPGDWRAARQSGQAPRGRLPGAGLGGC